MYTCEDDSEWELAYKAHELALSLYLIEVNMTPTSKTLLFTIIFLFFMLQEFNNGEPWTVQAEGIDCGSACAYRCSKASRQKICMRACGTCCERCHCVPPGTSGNRDACPYYANMTTHGGKLKCP